MDKVKGIMSHPFFRRWYIWPDGVITRQPWYRRFLRLP